MNLYPLSLVDEGHLGSFFFLFELLFGISLGFFVKAFHLCQLQSDVFSFSCVMSASSKRSEWQRSMALFEDMLQLSIPRNVTWRSLIVAWATKKSTTSLLRCDGPCNGDMYAAPRHFPL